MSDDGSATATIRRGAPGSVAGVAIPALAVALVVIGTARDAGPDEPVAPAVVAVVTLLGAGLLGWRAATQRAELRADELWCRNLSVSFAVEWDRVEALRVVRRYPMVVVEVRVADLRRTHRVGAATRFSWEHDQVDEVLALLRSHPRGSAVVEETAS